MTTSKSVKEVFKAFKSQDLLVEIASHRRIPTTEDENDTPKSKSDIVKLLVADVTTVGFKKLVQTLNVKLLKEIIAELIPDEKERPKIKAILVKRISEQLNASPHEFLEKLTTDIKLKILEHLTEDPPSNKKEYDQAIIAQSETMGLENCFSAFEPKKLIEFAEDCGLRVDTGSVEVIIDCILNQESAKPKKKVKPPKMSKSKPEIKKGITRVDLRGHFYREELQEFCKTHELRASGKKSELIAEILAYLDGKAKPVQKRGKKSKSGEESEGDSKKEEKKEEKEKKRTKSEEEGEEKEEEEKSSKKAKTDSKKK